MASLCNQLCRRERETSDSGERTDVVSGVGKPLQENKRHRAIIGNENVPLECEGPFALTL